jgi:hypothetical protein
VSPFSFSIKPAPFTASVGENLENDDEAVAVAPPIGAASSGDVPDNTPAVQTMIENKVD